MKTLKWIYDLGYKHAENKLYHKMLKAVNSERPDELEMFGHDKKSEYTKQELQHRQEVTYRLNQLIEAVFSPTVNESVEYFERNRFEL